MGTYHLSITLCLTGFVLLTTACRKEDQQAPAPTPIPPVTIEYSFDTTAVFWGDEFDYTGAPEQSKWGYEVGGGGWGNNELQYYTQGQNAQVTGGNLVIEARKESFGGREYTSTRLISKDKGTFTYGRVEVRAKLPSGRGTWPAIWMLANKQVYGNTYWPDNGEIDIMEHVGFDPNVVHFSIHTNALNWTKQTQQTAKTNVPTALTDFHVYRLDWTPVGLKGYVDNRLYFDFPNGRGGWQVWPFDQPFFMLLNIAVGGNWGGQQGVDDSVFPQRLEVDYVRVYKLVEKRK